MLVVLLRMVGLKIDHKIIGVTDIFGWIEHGSRIERSYVIDENGGKDTPTGKPGTGNWRELVSPKWEDR